MRKAMVLILVLSAAVLAFEAAPQPAQAQTAADCFWYCDCTGVHCSCGSPRLCPWPPPPIACPACDW